MQLAVKAAKPPIVGRVNLTTHMLLPAGPEDVVDRLQLDGRFELAQARFTNLNVQRRITTLSRRGRGEESDEGGRQQRRGQESKEEPNQKQLAQPADRLAQPAGGLD